MELLRNASKYFFGNPTSQETLIEISQGQLYIVRPLSPKGYSELIFRDANCSIRRTGQPFQYQLVIQRAYEEGEEELLEDDDGEGDGLTTPGLSPDKDERTFLLDETLRFRSERREGGELVFAWRDLSGDEGDLYEFVCDTSTQETAVSEFEIVAVECQYERKYRKGHETATQAALQEFNFSEQPVPDVGGSPIQRSPNSSQILPPRTSVGKPFEDAEEVQKMAPKTPAKSTTQNVGPEAFTTVAPPSRVHPESQGILAREAAELHLFAAESGTFVLQDSSVTATVYELGDWNYWLKISSDQREWLGQPVIADVNPVFNFEYLSFIFNHYLEDGSAYSWLLRVKDQTVLERWQHGFMQALWEHLNKAKWGKVKDDDRDYILEAFNDLAMEDADQEQELEEQEEEDESEDEGPQSEHYDSDESEDDVDVKGKDSKNANSQLAVGYKHGRSFVVRGSKIGVFKHTDDNRLQFDTNISKVQTPGKNGKLFSPKKVMLHMQDRDLILQNPDDPNSLYRMDLEVGKVVDEWKIDDNVQLRTFAPNNKFAQTTSEPTMVGVSHNALYRIDPRLADTKLVKDQFKQYASKNDFSAAATTEKGYVAVASNKGDIRLFDRLGINAKTLLPALGEQIVGVDVSADGRWILGTTKTYILLIDALQQEGPNKGKLGFEKAFGKDSKPQPRRLALSPSHIAQMMHETKTPINFAPAHFNTGAGVNETTIVTATGPYAVIWSMKKVLKNQRDPYSIKRYEEDVKADDFKYGTDKNLIVALPNEVGMVSKGQLKRPTRESIVGSPMRSSIGTPSRRSGVGRASGLRKNDIVDSPY